MSVLETVKPYRILLAESNTPEWLKLRKSGIGASEAAAILGDSAWGTPRSVYEQKVNDEIEDFTTDLMEFGHLAEPLIVAFMALHPERFGWMGEIIPAEGLLQSIEWPWLLGTLDRQCITPDGTIVPVELKSINDFVAAEWRASEGFGSESDGDDYVVPKKYQVQVQQQMAIQGAPFAYVVAWLGKSKVVVIRVDRDDEYIEKHLVGTLGDYWEFNVQARVAPPISPGDDYWAIYPGDKALDAIEADEDLLDTIGQWRIATTDARELKTHIDELKFTIVDRMGNVTEIVDPTTGKVIHTLRGQRTARKVDRTLLEAKYPDAFAECVSEPGWTRVHRATKEPVG